MSQEKGDTLVIIYASQTGNAESIGKHIHQEALSKGYTSHCYVADDFASIPWSASPVFLFITSTTGDGDHPDNSAKFWKWMRRGKKEDLAQFNAKQYALLGLGDTNYTNFCQPAKRLDRKLTELGATPFIPKVLADDATGLEAAVDPWVASMWEALPKVLNFDPSNAESGSESVAVKDTAVALEQAAPSLSSSEASLDLPPAAEPSKKDDRKESPTDRLKSLQIQDTSATIVSGTKLQMDKIIPSVALETSQLTNVSKLPKPYLLLKETGDSRPVTESSVSTILRIDGSSFSPNNPFLAKIESVSLVSGSKAINPVLDVKINIKDLDWKYSPGDAFGLVVENPKDQVLALLNHLKLDPESVIDLSTISGDKEGLPYTTNQAPSYFEVFSYLFDICPIFKKPLLRVLGEYATDMNEKKAILYLTSTNGLKAFKTLREERPSLLDFFATFPSCEPPVTRLLEVLPRLQPRYYSVRNSPSTHNEGNSVSFVFNVIQDKVISPLGVEKQVLGLASNYIDSIMGRHRSAMKHFGNDGPALPVFGRVLDSAMGFHLPSFDEASFIDDKKMDFVFIAAGTGISPFIGFLEHLQNLKQKGDSHVAKRLGSIWLFYGHRFSGPKFESDVLFQEELDAFVKAGLLTRWVDCVSREPSEGDIKYVQDGLKRHANDIWPLLAEGRVYVCGYQEHVVPEICQDYQLIRSFLSMFSSVKMASDVHATLIQLTTQQSEKSLEEAALFWQSKSQSRSYLKDIWG